MMAIPHPPVLVFFLTPARGLRWGRWGSRHPSPLFLQVNVMGWGVGSLRLREDCLAPLGLSCGSVLYFAKGGVAILAGARGCWDGWWGWGSVSWWEAVSEAGEAK